MAAAVAPEIAVAEAEMIAAGNPPYPGGDDANFEHCLEYVIQLNTAAQRQRIMVNAGIANVEDLLLVGEEDIIDCFTPATSAMCKTRMRTLKRWAQNRNDVGEDYDIRLFTITICRSQQLELARTGKLEGDEKSSSGVKTKLTKFNGRAEKWNQSKRELVAYLNQIKNNRGIPIYYVVRDPDLETEYRNEHGKIGELIYDARYQGRDYENDSFRVLQILKQWTSGGTAEAHIDSTSDVQVAWDNLIKIYEGVDARSTIIGNAREAIRTAHWSRDTQNFNLDDYCNKHICANNDLNRYQSNVDGASQVNQFLRGIKADANINSHLLGLKSSIVLQNDTRDDLNKAIISFKQAVKVLGHSTKQGNDRRQIGAQTRGRGYGRGQGGRPGGRYGNYRGRG